MTQRDCQVPIEVQVETQFDAEMDLIYSKYGKLIRGKNWKAPIPEGVDGIGCHINDSHLDTYFQQYEPK